MRVYAADNVQRPAENNALHGCGLFDRDMLSEDQPIDLAVNEGIAGDEFADDAGTFIDDGKSELSAVGFFRREQSVPVEFRNLFFALRYRHECVIVFHRTGTTLLSSLKKWFAGSHVVCRYSLLR